jgi:hypothetical protein
LYCLTVLVELIFNLSYSDQIMKPRLFLICALVFVGLIDPVLPPVFESSFALAGGGNGQSSETVKKKKKKKKKKNRNPAQPAVADPVGVQIQPGDQLDQEECAQVLEEMDSEELRERVSVRLEGIDPKEAEEKDLSFLIGRFFETSKRLAQEKEPMPNWLATTLRRAPVVGAIGAGCVASFCLQYHGITAISEFMSRKITLPLFNAVTGCTLQLTESGVCSIWPRIGANLVVHTIPIFYAGTLRDRLVDGMVSLSYNGTRACVSSYIAYRNRFIQTAEFRLFGELIRDALVLESRADELRTLPETQRRLLFQAAARIGLVPLMRVALDPENLDEKAILDSLPVQEDVCSICRESFSNLDPADPSGRDTLVKSNCNHYFHRSCLTTWFQSTGNISCPNCRADSLPLLEVDQAWKANELDPK